MIPMTHGYTTPPPVDEWEDEIEHALRQAVDLLRQAGEYAEFVAYADKLLAGELDPGEYKGGGER